MLNVKLPVRVIILGIQLECIDVDTDANTAPFPEVVFSE